MIKVITFDVGGTLIAPQESIFKFLPKEILIHKKEIKEILYTVKNYTNREEELLSHFLTQDQIELLKNHYNQKREIELYPFVHSLFSLLSKNYTIAIASNRNCLSQNTVKFDNIKKYISAFFYSTDIGIAKPSEKFFKKCSEILSVPCSQILHVGDNSISDVSCSLKAGCQSMFWDNQLPKNTNIHHLLKMLDDDSFK